MKATGQNILKPEAKLLLKYGYIELTKTTRRANTHNGVLGHPYNGSLGGYIIKTDFPRLNMSVSKFRERFYSIADKRQLRDNIETLMYVVLEENELAIERIHAELDSLQYKAIAKGLAELISKEVPEGLFKLSLADRKKKDGLQLASQSLKLASDKVAGFIVKAVTEKLLMLDRTVLDLGPEVLRILLGDSCTLTNTTRLNTERITMAAKQIISLKDVKTRRTAMLTECMLKIWHFMNQETNLKATGKTKFTDAQLAFLYDVAVLLGWKNRALEGNGAGYIRSMFSNYLNTNSI